MEKVKKLAGTFVSDYLIEIKLDDGGSFHVQKATLCSVSEYFRKALTGGFLESETKTLHISDCSTASFELILYWLRHLSLPDFSQMFNGTYEKKQLENDKAGFHDEHECRIAVVDQFYHDTNATSALLANLWVHCDMLLMPALQNEAVRQLVPLACDCGTPVDAMRIAFGATPCQSALRRLLIDCFVHTTVPYKAVLPEDDDRIQEIDSIPGILPALLQGLHACSVTECQGSICTDEDHNKPDINNYLVPEN